MAKNEKSEAKKEEQQASTSTALAPAAGGALAAALEGVDVGDGGLGEVDNTDIKIAAKVWNFKGTDANNEPILPNVFYDTVQETTAKTLDLTLLDLHKTREWREFDQGEKKSKRRCSAPSVAEDAIGTMEDGSTRPCKGCPDAQWRNVVTDTGKTKRTRNCGPVYNVTAIERGGERAGEPCVLRFKRTSLPVIQGHLQKHHLGKLALGGGRRGNVALYALGVRASLKMMGTDVKYAVPVLEVTGVLSNAEVRAAAESARFYREIVLPALDALAEKDQDGGGSEGGDTSFDPDSFGGDDARPRGGDRFFDDRAR